ncbi:MAG: N-6 DNA methylase [Terracidiphilus sp.]
MAAGPAFYNVSDFTLTQLKSSAAGQRLPEDFFDPKVNLSPLPVKDSDGHIKLPALDNHGMGTVFEEIIRRFNEENNKKAGEHFTPRDVVQLMGKLPFLPVIDRIESLAGRTNLHSPPTSFVCRRSRLW